MEEYLNMSYVIPLVLLWIVSGWSFMVKRDCDAAFDYVTIHHTFLYGLISIIPTLSIIVSFIINIFEVGFVSTLCYIGIVMVTQFININCIYLIYRKVFGCDGIGTLIPLIAIIPLTIYLFVVQFS